MAVNSSVFLNLLKELKCPDVENLEAKSLDWLFQDDSCKEFITSLCTRISGENYLTDDEIKRFRSGKGPILKGKYLEQALSGLKTKEEKRFWEQQPSCSEQQSKEYQEVAAELEEQYANASEEGEMLKERHRESHRNLAFEERKLNNVEESVNAAKEGLHKQTSQLRELKDDQEPVVLNQCSLDPLHDEVSKFDNDIATFINRPASLDFKSLWKDAENILCPDDLKDYAGTFDSESRQREFQEEIKAKYPILLKKFFDRKIKNAGLAAEMERLEQLEKSSDLPISESRLKPEVEVEELEATFQEGITKLPQIETPYHSKIAVQKSNRELLQLTFAWTMYSKVEDWMCGRLSITELIDYILRNECKGINSLRMFLEDFQQHLKENSTEMQHSLDTKLPKDGSDGAKATSESVSDSFADSTKLFEKVENALKCVKRASELVKEEQFTEIEKELDTIKASEKKMRTFVREATKDKTLHEQASRERSRLNTLLDRDLWVYFYAKPEKLNAIAKEFRK